MIEVQNISKNFGAFQALQSISFNLAQGEVVGFLGPNGAGKTTTMRILTGYLPATSGSVTIDDLDIQKNPQEIQKKIGYLPESAALYGDMETSDYLKYIGQIRQISPKLLTERLKEVIKICSLREALGKKISTLSKGYRQRVGLAQALLHDPEILILDEPTVGLDPNQISEIRSLIHSLGKNKTILLSTHILSEVEQTCSRVIIIARGKIVGAGKQQDLITQTPGATTLEDVFKILTT